MNSDEIILELKNIHKTFGANHIHRGINIKLHAQESVHS